MAKNYSYQQYHPSLEHDWEQELPEYPDRGGILLQLSSRGRSRMLVKMAANSDRGCAVKTICYTNRGRGRVQLSNRAQMIECKIKIELE